MSNSYEQLLDRALKAWQESESILSLLRIDDGQPVEKTHKEIIEWYRNLHR
jgi:hypothetical protein